MLNATQKQGRLEERNGSRDITVFNNKIISQLVGHLLVDGSIHYSQTSVTPYFVFTQTIKRFKYVWHVYITLSPYCGRVPLINPGLRKGKPHHFTPALIFLFLFVVFIPPPLANPQKPKGG